MKRFFHEKGDINHGIEGGFVNMADRTFRQDHSVFNQHFLKKRKVLGIILLQAVKHQAIGKSMMYPEGIAYPIRKRMAYTHLRIYDGAAAHI